eukprot:TRINITY_DN21806_c0_g1_i1.p4 TRINITY_DN21806_c0_g1~~TRINITY_DN21806_c0_g1_i1.p4  ORF type:complete len:105 (+),score=14.84 TRINITY_DN21806_c0_g1_i1:448-762(+)
MRSWSLLYPELPVRFAAGPRQWPGAAFDAYNVSGWPLAEQGSGSRAERGKWRVRFHADTSQAAAGDPQRLPRGPPLWAAAVRGAVAHEGNVHTCALVLGAGGCR